MLILSNGTVWAEENRFHNPERIGLGLTLGHSYDPEPTFGFMQVTGIVQYDYDQIMLHRAPEVLYFKVEGSLGAAGFNGNIRLMTSVNILAQYYLERFNTENLRPYAEAGTGLIYTDFQVEGQGLRLNFNPQAGIGCELRSGKGAVWFTNFRIHHLSNGSLYHENRGINSVSLQAGSYF